MSHNAANIARATDALVARNATIHVSGAKSTSIHSSGTVTTSTYRQIAR